MFVYPCNRTPAGADFDNIQHGGAYRKSALISTDKIGGLHFEPPFFHQCAFGRRPAHIKGDDPIQAQRLGVSPRTNAAANRPGFNQRDGLLQRLFNGQPLDPII